MKGYSYRQRLPLTTSPNPSPPSSLTQHGPIHLLTTSAASFPSFSKSSFPLPNYSKERGAKEGMRSSSSFDSLAARRSILPSGPLAVAPVFQPVSPFTTLRLPRPNILPVQQTQHRPQSSTSRKYNPWSQTSLLPVRQALDRRHHVATAPETNSGGHWFAAHIPLLASPSKSSSSDSKFTSRMESTRRMFPSFQLRHQRYPSHENAKKSSAYSFDSHIKAPDFRNSASIKISSPPPPEKSLIPPVERDDWDEGSSGSGPRESRSGVPGPPTRSVPPPVKDDDKWSSPQSWTESSSNHISNEHFVTEIPTRPENSWSGLPASTGWHHSSNGASDHDRGSNDYNSYGSHQPQQPSSASSRGIPGSGSLTSWSMDAGRAAIREGVAAQSSAGNEDGYHPVSAYQRSYQVKSPDSGSSTRDVRTSAMPHPHAPQGKVRPATLSIYHHQPSGLNGNSPAAVRSPMPAKSQAPRAEIAKWNSNPISPAQGSQPSVSSIQDILNVVRMDEKH